MEESAEARSAIMRYYEAIAAGDTEWIGRFVSRQAGALVIGTDPNEWWTGHDTIISAFRGQFEAVGGGFPIRAGDLEVYSEGNVAWTAGRPAFIMPDGTELPLRLTTVLHKEDGEWKLVQHHISIGVPNEEAIGQDLPV